MNLRNVEKSTKRRKPLVISPSRENYIHCLLNVQVKVFILQLYYAYI